MGKKTAYIELNTSSQISSLHKRHVQKPFNYLGIGIFPCVTVTSLSEILALNYDYFVLDIGVLNAYTLKDFLKCDQRFLVCSLSKWKVQKTKEKLEKFFQYNNINTAHVTVLCNLVEEESKVLNFSNLSFPIISFPFIPNPFQLKPDVFHVFHQILERK